MDNDGSTITQCTGDQDKNCGVYETCISDALLGVDRIMADSTYTITIQSGTGFNKICTDDHKFSLNVKVTLNCAITPARGISINYERTL